MMKKKSGKRNRPLWVVPFFVFAYEINRFQQLCK